MKVIATALGFAGALRQVGETFEMPDDAKATWFKEVVDEAKAKTTKASKAPAAPTTPGPDESLT